MKVEVAETAGFCFGVKRAMDMVYEQLDHAGDTPVYSYGPIIHNDLVMEDLKKRGLIVLDTFEELKGVRDGVVILRSHGVPPKVYNALEENGVPYVDTTCPFVRRIHEIVREESEKGSHIVIIGDPAHPEVEGIAAWAGSDVTVIPDEEASLNFQIQDKKQRVCIVSQTTFNCNKFQDYVENIRKKGYDIIVFNTICNATKERQKEAFEIAKRVDVMIVIGDERSSNTRKLFEICRNACADTYYIQTLDDLNMNQLRSVEAVGITAGASTPNNIIEEVQKNVRADF